MKIKTVSYVGSYGDARSLPRSAFPEVAFVGRSNVGKSSLINALVGRRNIARTSNVPGKTRTANWYLVNERFCFVDMPGYGYAKISREERSKWRELIARYIRERERLEGVVQLLDVRHAPSDADNDMASSIENAGRKLCLAFNKVDKIPRGRVRSDIARHLRALDVGARTAVVAFSSQTGEGKEELWTWILKNVGDE